MTDPDKWHKFDPGFPNGTSCKVCGGASSDGIHYQKISGYEQVHEFSKDEPLVAMVVFNDCLYVATSRGVYAKWDDGKLHRLEIVEKINDC
jgi:hypothetical protein